MVLSQEILFKFPHDSTKHIGGPVLVFPDKSMGDVSDVTDVPAFRLPCPNVSLVFKLSLYTGLMHEINK